MEMLIVSEVHTLYTVRLLFKIMCAQPDHVRSLQLPPMLRAYAPTVLCKFNFLKMTNIMINCAPHTERADIESHATTDANIIDSLHLCTKESAHLLQCQLMVVIWVHAPKSSKVATFFHLLCRLSRQVPSCSNVIVCKNLCK